MFDFGGGRDYILWGGHGEIRFVNFSRRSKEAAYGVGNQHGVFLNFRLTESVHAFLEYPNNRERKTAAEPDDLADRGLRGAVEFLGEFLGNHSDFATAERVFGIEKPPGENLQIAYAEILRFDPQDQDVTLFSASHANPIFQWDGGRSSNYAGNLLSHRPDIVDGHWVGSRVDAVSSPLVLGMDHVRADRLQLTLDVLFPRKSDRSYQNY